MSLPFLLDTGPRVAFLDQKDHFHAWANKVLSGLPSPLLTCEAVITETCYLLRKLPNGSRKPLQMIREGILIIPFIANSEMDILEKMMGKYSNVPMSFADACLVRMVEIVPQSTLITMDKDFLIYRKNDGQRISLLKPDR